MPKPLGTAISQPMKSGGCPQRSMPNLTGAPPIPCGRSCSRERGAAKCWVRVLDEREWVFPGEAEGKQLHDIKWFWADVRTKAELPALRVRDLRNTFASLLVTGGMTLPMIGKLLGHTQFQTTQRSAHLLDDPQRAGPEQLGIMFRTRPQPIVSFSTGWRNF